MLTPSGARFRDALGYTYTIANEKQVGNCDMVPAVWNGLLRFGLLTIPVKLYRAAQAEKVSFRQIDKQTGARVRHPLYRDGSTRGDHASLEAGPCRDRAGQAEAGCRASVAVGRGYCKRAILAPEPQRCGQRL